MKIKFNTFGTMEFGCTSCGLCCKNVGAVVQYARNEKDKGMIESEYADFPYSFKDNGECEMLSEDGKCTVYDKRPDVCSVEKMWQKYGVGLCSKKEYFKEAGEVCNEMILEEGLEEKYLVDLKQYD